MEGTCFRNKIPPIWDVMICKDLYGLAPNEERFIQDCADHYGANTPAEEIIEYTNRYFAADSGFAAGVSESLADGMEELNFEKSALIYDTLKANLYCVLLLEAMGQTTSDGSASNLSELIKAHFDAFSKDISLQEFSTALSKFPNVLKELFAIGERARTGTSYRIATRYPKLLLAESLNVRNMPLTDTGSTPSSYILNQRYYSECVKVIKNGPDWTGEAFAQYYLFERVFRLNIKSALFWGEQKYAQKGQSVSPALLADCLFPSPLVLLPQDMLPKLLYKDWSGEPFFERQAKVLQFLIRLSLQFLYSLKVLRIYMDKHSIKSPEQITSFFFPETKDFTEFLEEFTPRYKLAPEDGSFKRNLREAYSNRWGAFIPAVPPTIRYHPARSQRIAFIDDLLPRFVIALTPLNRELWNMKEFERYDDLADDAVCKSLRNLP